ncbi:hypothetical protein AVEN_231107-1 [Araneus ventricosus]|uniref:WW domain-containing protein n=1 Tax=Araneus ventricosus TaxID=182803 RepID=A0A4Y2QNK9_ARAVE|nr:hypothetical protein AVEN_231107-1 [Araneus ventricosus]
MNQARLSSLSILSVENSIAEESGDENAIDTDAMTDDILEVSSELIDKLTFLLSAPSTHASFSGVFFQLQTRFVDWQAGALDSTYFMARLKELEQYIQHYETGVISGEWTYQWDRENKRYFFINTRTQHSQWTYPEELCNQDKSSWVQSQAEAGPSSASSFAAERDDLQTVSSSSTMHENSAQKHSTSSFTLESKDNSSGSRWILQSSPPPPPPGVDSPPPPPHTPPPKSPPPPPPDSTETLREPEDMDLENSNDSSSFLFVNNKTMADDGRLQFISMVEQSSKRSPVSFANASIFNAVSSTSMSGCEDLSTVSKLSHSVPHSLECSEINNVHWSRPSCSSQVKINSNSTGSVLSIDVPVNLNEEKNSDIHASSSNGVCSSQSDALHLKPVKPGNAVSKKEKKKTKIQPGLGLKKKNIPSLVEKWQKIKEQQDREDNDPDDCKSVNSF